MIFEAVDWSDPLSLLLAREGAADEVDALHSLYEAGGHRTRTMEVERTIGDMLGASPFELSNPDWH